MLDMDGSQCRAARALLGWSQGDLAKHAKVSGKTIWDFETANRDLRAKTIESVSAALEKAGIMFIPENGGGPGVRLAKRKGKGSGSR
jgi:transcriptional regulator with XRE-family HTH domain